MKCFRCNEWDGERCECKDGQTIFHADCREILPILPPVELILTDPPYGISHSSHHGASWQNTTIANDADTSCREEVLGLFSGLPMAVFGTWKTAHVAGTRAVLIWDKGPAFGMGNLSFPWKPSFEEIYIVGDGWNGRRDEGVLKGHLVVSWESKGRVHPHQKPVSLIQALIRKAPPGTILDPFMGSGTTLVAAKLEGRRAIGIELEQRYCEIADNRLRQGVLALN